MLPALLARAGDGTPRYVPTAMADRIVGCRRSGRFREPRASRPHRTWPAARHTMFETMAGFVMGDHIGGLTYEPPLDKGGYARHLSPDRRPYQTADGFICVIVYNDKQWRELL